MSANRVPHSQVSRVRILNWILIPALPFTLSRLTELQNSRQLLLATPLLRLTFE
jgi:hypothetical protein